MILALYRTLIPVPERFERTDAVISVKLIEIPAVSSRMAENSVKDKLDSMFIANSDEFRKSRISAKNRIPSNRESVNPIAHQWKTGIMSFCRRYGQTDC